jgi:hypothetical protein
MAAGQRLEIIEAEGTGKTVHRAMLAPALRAATPAV